MAVLKRVYYFEALAVANLAALLFLIPESLPIVGSPLVHLATLSISLGIQTVAGVALRSAVALFRRDRAWFRIIASPGWLLDTARIVFFCAVGIFDYGWMKLVIPLYRPVLFDEQLWQLDRILFFGLSPSEFLLTLFHGPAVLRAVDWSYSNIFYVSTFIAFAYFSSEPSRRVRVAFTNGNTLLWLAAAWFYLTVPSLGPAFRFPDIWLAHSDALRMTQGLQALLMRNYRYVIGAAGGEVAGPIQIMFGVAAFPSMHVAFQTYTFLWMRRLWTSGEVVFGIFVLIIFLGSMITGWHYLIDAVTGVAMAVGGHRLFWRRARVSRYLALRRALRR